LPGATGKSEKVNGTGKKTVGTDGQKTIESTAEKMMAVRYKKIFDIAIFFAYTLIGLTGGGLPAKSGA